MMDESDSLVTCPYNQSHVLYRSRMQTHLVKCKKAHENPQQNVEPIILKICKFNSNHHVPATQYEHHLHNCPDIGVLTRHITTIGTRSAIPYNPIDLPPTDENWDNEECASTYDPEQHVSSSVIIRAKQGVTKSARKTFRMQERERINRLRENQEALEKNERSRAQPPPQEERVNDPFSANALRFPKSALLGMGRGRLAQADQSQRVNGDALRQVFGQGLQDVPAMQPSPRNAALDSGCETSTPIPIPANDSSTDPETERYADAMAELVIEDGFIEQKSKRNKKKKNQAPVLNSHLPRGRGAVANPLIPGTGPVMNAALGVAEPRGRGRLP